MLFVDEFASNEFLSLQEFTGQLWMVYYFDFIQDLLTAFFSTGSGYVQAWYYESSMGKNKLMFFASSST